MNRDGTENGFSFSRVALLVRNKAYEDAPAILIGLAILIGNNLLSLVFSRVAVTNDGRGLYYIIAITGGGLLLSAIAFKRMHGRSSADWILLPASPLEKYAAAFISYIVIFPIAAAIGLSGVSVSLSLLEHLAGGTGGRIWHPFNVATLRLYGEYAAMAVAFLAGSATFRKRVFLKTVGVSIAYVLTCSLLVMLGLRIIYGIRFGDTFSVNFDSGALTIGGVYVPNADAVQKAFEYLVRGVRLALVPAFSVAFGYLRILEKEARDEVQ